MLNTDYLGTREMITAARLIAGQLEEEGGEQHRITQRDQDLIRDLRYVMRENQTQFWCRFGVTQTQGSRYERGKSIPLSVLLLIRLYLLRIVGDTDLQYVRSPDFGKSGQLQPAEAIAAGN